MEIKFKSIKSIFTATFLVFLLSAFSCSLTYASDQPLIVFEGKKKNRKNQAVTISKIRSKTIELHRQKQRIDFIDHVVVEREDVDFLADKMEVYYHQKEKDKALLSTKKRGKKDQGSSIEKIDAFGHVKIFQDEFVATGDIGTYNPKSGIFIIEQNVIFNTGTSVASGDKFIYDVNTKKGYLSGKKNYLTKSKTEPKSNSKSDKNSINEDFSVSPKDNRVIVIIDEKDETFKKDKKKKSNEKPSK